LKHGGVDGVDGVVGVVVGRSEVLAHCGRCEQSRESVGEHDDTGCEEA
jgi:hypothetical protein